MVGGCASEAERGAPAVDAARNAEAGRAAALTDRDDARGAWVRVRPAAIAGLPGLSGVAAGAGQRIPIPAARQGDFSICPNGNCAMEVGEVTGTFRTGA